MLKQAKAYFQEQQHKKLLQIYKIQKSNIHIYERKTSERKTSRNFLIKKNILQNSLQQNCKNNSALQIFLRFRKSVFFFFLKYSLANALDDFGNLWINKRYHNVTCSICHRKAFMIMSKTTRMHERPSQTQFSCIAIVPYETTTTSLRIKNYIIIHEQKKTIMLYTCQILKKKQIKK